MSHIVLRRILHPLMIIGLVVTCTISLGRPLTDSEKESFLNGNFHSRWEWANGNPGTMLEFIESSAELQTKISLVESPFGARATILSYVWPRKSVSIVRIRDDESDWWAELEEESNFRLDHTGHLSDPGRVSLAFTRPDLKVKRTFRSVGTDEFTFESGSLDALSFHEFSEQFEADGLTEPLISSMPGSIRDLVTFLSSAAELKGNHHSAPNLGHWSFLVGFLDTRVGSSHGQRVDRYQGASWRNVTLGAALGAEVDGEDSLAFARRFKSVSATDPLLGQRVNEARAGQ